MSTPTVLPASALGQLTPVSTAPPPRYVVPALSRAALYLSPLLLGLAAAAPLAALPWLLPAGALATGWCALSVLAAGGRATAGQAGVAPAARRVLAGFTLVAVGWSAALAVIVRAPAWLPDRFVSLAAEPVLAYAVSLSTLVLAALVAVAVATGTEPMVLRWCLPAGLAAVAIAGGWLVDLGQVRPQIGHLPVELLLPAALVLPLLRVGFLAAGPRRRETGPHRPGGERPARRLSPARWGSSGCYLLLGAAQVGLVIAAWQVARPAMSTGGVPPSVLPLLLTLPAVELWLGWHRRRGAPGLARYDEPEAHVRYVRRLAWTALGVLLPPLVAGTALLAAAPRLPYGLARHPDPPALVHALATGVLLAGLVALGALLATRQRPGLAALVTGAPLLAIPVLSAGLLTTGSELVALPAALAAAYALGLVLAAHVLLDARAGAPAPPGLPGGG